MIIDMGDGWFDHTSEGPCTFHWQKGNYTIFRSSSLEDKVYHVKDSTTEKELETFKSREMAIAFVDGACRHVEWQESEKSGKLHFDNLLARRVVGTRVLDLIVRTNHIEIIYSLAERGHVGKKLYAVHFDSVSEAVRCYDEACAAYSKGSNVKRVLQRYVRQHSERLNPFRDLEALNSFIEKANALEDQVWKDYARNSMTDKQWQKKYPGIPENRAAGTAVTAWCRSHVFEQLRKGKV